MDQPTGFGLYDWKRARREPAPVEEVQFIADQADQPSTGPNEFGWQTQPFVPWTFAQITNADNAPLYSWVEVFADQTNTQLGEVDSTGPLQGTTNALEINSNLYVPVGAYVKLWPTNGLSGGGWAFEFIAWTLVAVAADTITPAVGLVPGFGPAYQYREVAPNLSLSPITTSSATPVPVVAFNLYPVPIAAGTPMTLTREPYSGAYFVASFGEPGGSTSSSSTSGSTSGHCVEVVTNTTCDPEHSLIVTQKKLCGTVEIGGITYPITLTLDGGQG